MIAAPALDLPREWEEALDQAWGVLRVAVVGPTDAGKSSFIRALAARAPERCVIDLDPGQKMLGAPGTAALGRVEPEPRLDRFVFLGSTAHGSFRTAAGAAAQLAGGAASGFIVNTSGYVEGPGARLQAMVLAALRPDLVVAIGASQALAPVLSSWRTVAIQRSASARRKTPAIRAALRTAALRQALSGARALPLQGAAFEPAAPAPWTGTARPVCALADAAGKDMEIGILIEAEPVTVFARSPARRPCRVRLGKMWAEDTDDGWKLLEGLAPSWTLA